MKIKEIVNLQKRNPDASGAIDFLSDTFGIDRKRGKELFMQTTAGTGEPIKAILMHAIKGPQQMYDAALCLVNSVVCTRIIGEDIEVNSINEAMFVGNLFDSAVKMLGDKSFVEKQKSGKFTIDAILFLHESRLRIESKGGPEKITPDDFEVLIKKLRNIVDAQAKREQEQQQNEKEENDEAK